MPSKYDIQAIGKNFRIVGEFLHANFHGAGNINDTYVATYHHAGIAVRYIHQRINHHVFKQPLQLMENVQRITEHQYNKLQQNNAQEITRHCLILVESLEGHSYFQDQDGNTWRTYLFIENAQTYDVVTSVELAYETAKAFGEFQKMLLDLPGPSLYETIPGFHNTPQRLQHLQAALAADRQNRAKDCQKEIDFASKHQAMVRMLLDLQTAGRMPVRAVHNDTKPNNVMISDTTHTAICVIDLDTVMPGLAVYDFGDLIRASTSPVGEDEQDLSKVTMQFPIFEGLVQGYLEAVGGFLTATEKDYLVFSGKLITFENGLRFLTDHLNGDQYFKIHRDGHNLDRCRTQFKLVESIQQQEETMNRFIENFVPSADL